MRYERSEFSITQLNKCLRSKPSQSRRNKRKKEVKRKEKRSEEKRKKKKLPLESESFEEKAKRKNFLLKVNLLNFDAWPPPLAE